MKIIEKEFNVLTGEEKITERDETLEEKERREIFEAGIKLAEKNAQAKAAAKAALLERLGITEEEAKLLLG